MTEREMRNLFFEIHDGLNYQAPGEPDSTSRAYRQLSLPDSPRILDVGCGPGAQTLVLARVSEGQITGFDNYAPYLETLKGNADRFHLAHLISTREGDMRDMPFDDGSFDLIWCEGAAYIIGFERALREWRRLLAPRGGIALTELCWLKPKPPEEIAAFWREGYPAMRDVSANLLAIEECGYRPVGNFVLPERAWQNYYIPLEKRIAQLLVKYGDSDEKTALIAGEKREIEMRKQYAEWYGYVFFTAEADGPA